MECVEWSKSDGACQMERAGRIERVCWSEPDGACVGDGACQMQERVGWSVSDGACKKQYTLSQMQQPDACAVGGRQGR